MKMAPNRAIVGSNKPASPRAVEPRARGVIVLGWSSPIGRAIADGFLASGDQVTGIALENKEKSVPYFTVSADCSDPEQANNAVREAFDQMGRIDVVVLAAAVMPVASLSLTTDIQWRLAMGATLDAAFFVTRASVGHLSEGASIVAVSSVNSFLSAPGLVAYSAAKGGLDALIRQIALELGPQGIRANAVAPALIGGDNLTAASEGYPLMRTGNPKEVADAVHFLASDHASFITGVTLPVDGGLSIASPAAFLRPDLRDRFLAQESFDK